MLLNNILYMVTILFNDTIPQNMWDLWDIAPPKHNDIGIPHPQVWARSPWNLLRQCLGSDLQNCAWTWLAQDIIGCWTVGQSHFQTSTPVFSKELSRSTDPLSYLIGRGQIHLKRNSAAGTPILITLVAAKLQELTELMILFHLHHLHPYADSENPWKSCDHQTVLGVYLQMGYAQLYRWYIDDNMLFISIYWESHDQT